MKRKSIATAQSHDRYSQAKREQTLKGEDMNLNFDPMKEKDIKITQRNRIIVGISIISVIALIHIFRVGCYLKGDLYLLYYSYVSDLIIPFGIYFLLCINELYIKILRKWYIKATIILGFTTLAEIMQFFGIYALGNTFDFIDILMYALGVGIAVIFDRLLFKRFIPFWNIKTDYIL